MWLSKSSHSLGIWMRWLWWGTMVPWCIWIWPAGVSNTCIHQWFHILPFASLVVLTHFGWLQHNQHPHCKFWLYLWWVCLRNYRSFLPCPYYFPTHTVHSRVLSIGNYRFHAKWWICMCALSLLVLDDTALGAGRFQKEMRRHTLVVTYTPYMRCPCVMCYL
jgi:hypothetical protein